MTAKKPAPAKAAAPELHKKAAVVAKPAAKPVPAKPAAKAPGSKFDDFEDDIPF